MKSQLSVIILTRDEEINLPNALQSVLDWASEVIIVDSGSTDKTKEIAKQYGARFVEHNEYKNQAQQFNWALDNAGVKYEWILKLDADEYITPELRGEIQQKLESAPADISGFYMKRRVYFMGKWMKHGGYYPTWFLRLWRNGKAKMEEREMDEHAILDGRAERLANDFVDDNKKPLKFWIAKHNDFSSREAEARLREERNAHVSTAGGRPGQQNWFKQNFYLKFPMFYRAYMYFFYRYVIRLGFLDGREGLIFHFLQGCWHQFLIDAKTFEATKNVRRS